MKLQKYLLVLIYIMLLRGTICGYSSSSQISMSRTLSNLRCLPGQEISVTLSLQFDSLSNSARGVYIADNIPLLLLNSLQTLSVKLGGVEISDLVVVEHVSLESVYNGAVNVRWILETPPDFNENIPVNSNQNLIVKYSITIPSDAAEFTKYHFPNASWVAVINYLDTPTYEFGFEDLIVLDVVPVELTSFTAALDGDKVLLYWATATEVNNYGFEVERKLGVENSDWISLGFVEGHGNSNSPKEYSFTDKPLYGSEFKYRLKQIDIDGKYEYSEEIEISIPSPAKYELIQNYPNPFNPSTNIKYRIPEQSNVKIEIFNMLGQNVGILVNSEKQAGFYENTWNAENLTSGIYLISIKASGLSSKKNFTQVKKALLLK